MMFFRHKYKRLKMKVQLKIMNISWSKLLVLLLVTVAVYSLELEVHEGGSDVCWVDTYDRGAGKAPAECEGTKFGFLCYDFCPLGFVEGLMDCKQKCPTGWRDDGLFCRKAQYGVKLYPKEYDCMKANPHGCSKYVNQYAPKCLQGFTRWGCCVCRPQIPDCKALGFGSQHDLSCAKKISMKTILPLSCDFTQEKEGKLCYTACKDGYEGSGNTCKSKVPSGWTNCHNGGAARRSSDCSRANKSAPKCSTV